MGLKVNKFRRRREGMVAKTEYREKGVVFLCVWGWGV